MKIGDYVFVQDAEESCRRVVYKYRVEEFTALLEGGEDEKCEFFARFIKSLQERNDMESLSLLKPGFGSDSSDSDDFDSSDSDSESSVSSSDSPTHVEKTHAIKPDFGSATLVDDNDIDIDIDDI